MAAVFPFSPGGTRGLDGCRAGTPKPGTWKDAWLTGKARAVQGCPGPAAHGIPSMPGEGPPCCFRVGRELGTIPQRELGMLGAEGQAARLGELGHHFPPPPAFPRMLQRSWCQELRAIWKRSRTAVRDPLRQSPAFQQRPGSAGGSCAALNAHSGVSSPLAARGCRSQGQAGTCREGRCQSG